jgi:hypothetical protein
MARYYFDLREGDNVAIDDEGMKLLSIEAAQLEAARLMADMARGAVGSLPALKRATHAR